MKASPLTRTPSRVGTPLRATLRIEDSSPHQAQKDIQSFFQRAFFAPLWGRSHILALQLVLRRRRNSGYSKDPIRSEERGTEKDY